MIHVKIMMFKTNYVNNAIQDMFWIQTTNVFNKHQKIIQILSVLNGMQLFVINALKEVHLIILECVFFKMLIVKAITQQLDNAEDVILDT